MKNIWFFFCVLLLFGFLHFSLGAKSQTSSSGSINSYILTLSGAPLSTTNALNITLGFSNGSATLESGVTFKAGGATLLLSDVDVTKNLISVVWTGTASSPLVVSGMFKEGSVVGNPIISITKIQAAGGKDINSEVIASVQTTGPQPEATPTPTPTPSPSPTPSPTPTPPEEEGPSVSLSGPSTVELKKLRSKIIRITAVGANFDRVSTCISKSSDNSILRITPRRFLLSSKRNKIFLLGRVSPFVVRDLINNNDEADVTLSVSCSNEAEDELDITLKP